MSHDKKTKLTREEIAKLEIGHTDISPRLARVAIIVFLSLIAAVGLFQHVVELGAAVSRRREPGEADEGLQRAQICDIFRIIPKAGNAFQNTEGGLFRKARAANAAALTHINDYEATIESVSLMSKAIGPTQLILTGLFRQGNEKVCLGIDQWLFFRPGVEYVTGPGFLDPRQLARRRLAGNEYTDPPQPDPRKAIVQFHRQLSERGIVLIVVPTPVKPSVHPNCLSPDYDEQGPILQNASYDRFITELKAAGVRVFDPGPILQEAI